MLCSDAASVACTNCLQPVCNLHSAEYTESRSLNTGEATIHRYCDTCRQLFRITDETIYTAQPLGSALCCLYCSRCTVVGAPWGVKRYSAKAKEAVMAACDTARDQIREFNDRVSPLVPIKITRRLLGEAGEDYFTAIMYPRGHASYVPRQCAGSSKESDPLLKNGS